MTALQDGVQELYLLSWPLVPSQLEESQLGYCYVLLMREGGLLLAIPKGLMSQEDLGGGASGPEALVGPFTTLSVPTVRSEAEALVPREEDVEVVVADFGDQILQAMSPYDPELAEQTLGFDLDPQVLPDGPTLLRFAKEWIALSGAERAEFYSAEEVEVPKAKGKAKASEKAAKKALSRPSPQQVADHVKNISELLPAMAAQLTELRDEQKRIQLMVEGQGMATPPRASQAPVSMPMQQFAGLMGSPPKVKGLSLKPPPPKVTFALDSTLGIQEQAEEGSPAHLDAEGGGDSLALAVLEQSRALTSLVSHLQSGGDPLLDGTASSSSLSSKGAMNREKLQRELANRSGGFFLSVVQNAYKKLKPASKVPDSTQSVAATDFSMLQYLERFGTWQCSRHWNCTVCSEFHHRLCHPRGLGGGQGACSPHGCGIGASRSRWFEVGSWISVDAGGRCTFDYVVLPSELEPCPDWSTESFWKSMPPEVGHHCSGLHSRDGLHHQSPNGIGKEEPGCSTGPGARSKTEGKVPRGKRWRRRANAAARRGGAMTSSTPSLPGDLRGPDVLRGGGYDGGSASSSPAQNWDDFNVSFACVEKGFIRRPCSLFGWSGALLRHLLRGRTQFSYFVKLCLGCSGPRDEASGALFPIPLPLGDLWSGEVDRLSAVRRRKIAEWRILWLVIVSLNFAECDSKFLKPSSLWRCPGPHHCNVYDRLIALVRACGPDEDFSIFSCGRKSFQLDARFEELREALQGLGLDRSSFYGQHRSEAEVPVRNDSPELRPYTALVPERLKLVGEGKWDCRQYLSDLFYLPFVEPKVNQYDIAPPSNAIPDLSKVVKKDVVALCKIWDCRGLLRVFPESLGHEKQWALTKVFNNRKNETTDRQIGDRRGANFCEGRLVGPSRSLPTAASILQICPVRFKQAVVGSIADRRDFYHQFWTTDQRSATNALFPVMSLGDVEGTHAHSTFLQNFGKRRGRRAARQVAGDMLHLGQGHSPRGVLCDPETSVICCFGALYQGDHLGVEFACDAHGRMLEEAGVLKEGSRLSSAKALVDADAVSGLVIDDFFALSCEDLESCRTEPCEKSVSYKMFLRAKETYAKEGLLGSDDKDIAGSLKYKVCGGEINSSPGCVESGVVSLGAPGSKRYALSMLTMIAASWPYTTDSLHPCVVGSWISVLQLRRPAMAFINEMFRVIPPTELNPLAPRLRKLSRAAAQEMQIISCLSPILASNLAVPFSSRVFATDASMLKGGVVQAEVSPETAAVVWRTTPKKGDNVPMNSSFGAILRAHDALHEEVGSPNYADLEEFFGVPSGGVGYEDEDEAYTGFDLAPERRSVCTSSSLRCVGDQELSQRLCSRCPSTVGRSSTFPSASSLTLPMAEWLSGSFSFWKMIGCRVFWFLRRVQPFHRRLIPHAVPMSVQEDSAIRRRCCWGTAWLLFPWRC